MSEPQLMRFGPFELDPRAGDLLKDDVKVRLQEQPLQILLMLLQHPGEVVLRDEIRQRLWPDDTIVEFDHSINAAIKRLRDALGDSAEEPRYVETVARRGYRFIADVKSGPSAEAPAGKEDCVPANIDIPDRTPIPDRSTTHRLPWNGFLAFVAASILASAIWMLKPGPLTDGSVTKLFLDIRRAERFATGTTSISMRPSRTAIALSPDGRMIVFAGVRGDARQLFKRRLDEVEATALPGTQLFAVSTASFLRNVESLWNFCCFGANIPSTLQSRI